MTSLEKIAYIKGMIEGLSYEFKGDEGKILKEIIGLLETVCGEVTDLRESLDYTDRELAGVSDDLLKVEDRLYDLASGPVESFGFDESDDDDDSDEYDLEGCDCGCDHFPEGVSFVVCPACDARIELTDEDLEQGSISCPKCAVSLEFDMDDDCDCGHDHDTEN